MPKPATGSQARKNAKAQRKREFEANNPGQAYAPSPQLPQPDSKRSRKKAAAAARLAAANQQVGDDEASNSVSHQPQLDSRNQADNGQERAVDNDFLDLVNAEEDSGPSVREPTAADQEDDRPLPWSRSPTPQQAPRDNGSSSSALSSTPAYPPPAFPPTPRGLFDIFPAFTAWTWKHHPAPWTPRLQTEQLKVFMNEQSPEFQSSNEVSPLLRVDEINDIEKLVVHQQAPLAKSTCPPDVDPYFFSRSKTCVTTITRFSKPCHTSLRSTARGHALRIGQRWADLNLDTNHQAVFRTVLLQETKSTSNHFATSHRTDHWTHEAFDVPTPSSRIVFVVRGIDGFTVDMRVWLAMLDFCQRAIIEVYVVFYFDQGRGFSTPVLLRDLCYPGDQPSANVAYIRSRSRQLYDGRNAEWTFETHSEWSSNYQQLETVGRNDIANIDTAY